jgi:hypothetical protein
MVNPASYEIRAVIHFLHAKNLNPAEIQLELWATINGQSMSEAPITQWCRMFEDGPTDVHDEERSDRPFVLYNNLVQNVDQKICEKHLFGISELLCEFTQNLRTVLYKNTTVRLGYQNFCARSVPKMLTGSTKRRDSLLSDEFFRVIPQKWRRFLSRILRVTGDETWVSFFKVETKEQSKQRMHTHSLNRPKKLKVRCVPARKLMVAVFWDRKGMLVMEFMQQGNTITSEVYNETLK